MLHQIVSLFIVAQAALLVSAGVAHPAALRAKVITRQDTINLNTSAECSEPKVRKEWRNMEPAVQQEYISAVKCLFTKPSTINGNPGASLYDDFTTLHLQLKEAIHFTAAFLPWHRYYVHLYESALIDCGYTGAQPYWDWTLDAGPNVDKSPIFDPVTGFGGTGVDPTNDQGSPVGDGPFNNITVYAHSTLDSIVDYNKPHKLTRFFSSFVTRNNSIVLLPAFEDGSMNSVQYTPAMVEKIVSEGNSYDAFRQPFEGIPHAGVHTAIGGDMAPASSPNDPLFFLHHSNADRVWWHWQQRNPTLARDYSGNTVQNSGEQDASVSDTLFFSGLAGGDNPTVDQVLLTNSEWSRLCGATKPV